ncbi:ML domain-containing protein [Syncephalis fuscata]|nr:ML domain-containing protein [Syncephalis fuscata]
MKLFYLSLGGFAAVLFSQALLLEASSIERVLWQLGDNEDDGGSGLFSSVQPDLGKKYGESLYDCSDSSYILQIEDIQLNPDPPGRGQTLHINATGTFSEAVVEGSYAQVEVKYGFIKLINKKFDLCKEITQADVECPLGPGKITLERSIDLPKEIPPGKFHVKARVFSGDDTPIACLNAEIEFKL